MALISGLRALRGVAQQSPSSALPLFGLFGNNTFATAASLSKKEVVGLLDQRDDPEADAAVKSYLRSAYQGGKGAEASVAPSEELELAAKVEKKYLAAQIVEYGIQNIAVPLSFDKDANEASLKRYVAQLQTLGQKAGFESPVAEVEKRLKEASSTADTVRELLSRAAPYTCPNFLSQVSEALLAVETETNSTITLDGASPGYAKFAERVKAIAKSHNIPFQALLDAKQTNLAEDALDKAKKAAALWEQSAIIADIKAELAVLKADAAGRLDKHATKTSEQVRAEKANVLAALQRKIDSAKGAKWAVQFQQDLEYLQWFDSAVAGDPVSGPKVAV